VFENPRVAHEFGRDHGQIHDFPIGTIFIVWPDRGNVQLAECASYQKSIFDVKIVDGELSSCKVMRRMWRILVVPFRPTSLSLDMLV